MQKLKDEVEIRYTVYITQKVQVFVNFYQYLTHLHVLVYSISGIPVLLQHARVSR